jgi:hypothetical protein
MDIEDDETAQVIWMMEKLVVDDAETSQGMECDAC